MEIKGRKLTQSDYLSPITYIPDHANGDAGHKDCELGMLYMWDDFNETIFMINCKTRTVQRVDSRNLVWG